MNDTMKVLFGLFGGLAIFIFGMNMMSECLQKVAGDKMKKILLLLAVVIMTAPLGSTAAVAQEKEKVVTDIEKTEAKTVEKENADVVSGESESSDVPDMEEKIQQPKASSKRKKAASKEQEEEFRNRIKEVYIPQTVSPQTERLAQRMGMMEWCKNNWNVYAFDKVAYSACGKGNSNAKEVFIRNY